MNRAKAMEAFEALLDALEEAEEEERPRREKPRVVLTELDMARARRALSRKRVR